MKVLKFEKAQFRKGRNVTIRNGTKWFEDLEQHEVVELQNAKGKSFGEAKIEEITTFPANEVPEMILSFEHDPNARTPEGLKKTLQKTHGTGLDKEVTAIIFTRIPKED